MKSKEIELSVVVPVFNEEQNVSRLHRNIVSVCDRMGMPFEIIFVNDGSSDNTLKALKSLSPIRIINLNRNFGQTAALDAGIKSAQGKYIVTMDGDGQNDPSDIPKLLNKLLISNLDVVSGWRKHRRDSFSKRIVSKGALLLRSLLVHDGIHDSGCTLKAYRRECFVHVELYGEMHRFVPALLKTRGYKIGELVVKHHPRRFGKTKYSFKRVLKGAMDMVALWFWGKYSSRPLHLFGLLGLVIATFSVIAGALAIYRKFAYGIILSSSSLTYLSFSGLLIGVQFFIFGLLMDIVVRGYYASRHTTYYEISEIFEN